MQPTAGDLHVNIYLTNMSVGWWNAGLGFVADIVFPNIPSQSKSDLYLIHEKDPWFRNEMKRRAPGTPSAGSGWTVTQGTFSCEQYALHKDIADPVRRNADSIFNLDRTTSQFLMKQVMLQRDIDWKSRFFKTGVWGRDVAGVAASPSTNQVLQWDVDNSDPIMDVNEWRAAMARKSGMLPNTLVLSYDVFNVLKNHPAIIDRIKYTSSEVVTVDLLSRLFEMERIIVPTAIANSAKEGQTGSYDFLYSKDAFLCYSTAAPSIDTPTAGYTFSWTGLYGAAAWGGRIKKFRMEEIESDRMEIDIAYDMKAVVTELGTFIDGLIS